MEIEENWQQKDAHWARKQAQLEEKLKKLGLQKRELSRHKDTYDRISTKQTRLSHKDANIEELRLLLELSQEEIAELRKNASQDSERIADLESRLQNSQSRCKDLQKSNDSLSEVLKHKEKLVSKYFSKLAQLGEDLPEPLETSYFKSEDIAEEFHAQVTQPSVGKEAEVPVLSQQLAEMQEMYRISNEQAREQAQKVKNQEEELRSLRRALQTAKSEFSSLSGNYKRHTSDRDYQSQNLMVELEELRKKNDSHETEKRQLETRYKSTIEGMESELASSRQKVLGLLEDKNRVEKELYEARNAKKSLKAQIEQKEMKYNEVSLQLQNKDQEAELLKQQLESETNNSALEELNQQVKELSEALEVYQANEESSKHFAEELEKQNSELKEKLEVYEEELSRKQEQEDTNSQEALQKISYMILSKEAPTLDSKVKNLIYQAFGSNCSKLISTYEEKINQLNSENENLQSQLNWERERRFERLLENKEYLEVLMENKVFSVPDIEKKLRDTCHELQKAQRNLSSNHENLEIAQFQPKHEKRKSMTDLDSEDTESKFQLQKYKEEVAEAHQKIEALTEKLALLEVQPDYHDLVTFMQCNAAAIEDMLASEVIEDNFSDYL